MPVSSAASRLQDKINTIGTHAAAQADNINLPSHYFSGVFVILSTACLPLIQCTQHFYTYFHQLPMVIKSYAMLLVWDFYLILTYLARDLYNMSKGALTDGFLCKSQGFTNVAGTLALRISSAITAYAIYRMAKGKPIPDSTLWKGYALAWITGPSLGGLFIIYDGYGPYKGLYCCIKESHYHPMATIPCFIVTFSSIFAVLYYYYQATSILAQQKKRAAAAAEGSTASDVDPQIEVIVKRGLIHGLSFYVLWSLIITAGVITSVGGHVPVVFDLAAAWLVKMEATVDSYLLMNTIDMVLQSMKDA